MTQGKYVVAALAAAAVTVALSLPSSAQQRQNGQCWKAADGTKPYGYWADCPKPQAQARPVDRAATARTDAQAVIGPQTAGPGGGRPGQCWKAADTTKPYGYWADGPKPQRQARPARTLDVAATARTDAQAVTGPQTTGSGGGQSGRCWKATDGTKPYGYWSECK